MLTLSSPPRKKFPCFISFRQSGQQYKISWRGEKARFLEQNFVAVVVKTSLMKTDFISHRLTFFFVFRTKSAFNLLFSEFCC